MGLNITLTRPTGSGRTFSDDIPPGLYPGQIVKVEETEKKKYQSEETEEGIKFVIKLNNGVFAQYITSTSLGQTPKKSNLFKLIEALNPGAISAGQLEKDETAIPVIEGLKGRKCQLHVGQRVKGDRTYPTIESVLPVTGSAPVEGAEVELDMTPIAVDELEAEVGDSDDIPF